MLHISIQINLNLVVPSENGRKAVIGCCLLQQLTISRSREDISLQSRIYDILSHYVEN